MTPLELTALAVACAPLVHTGTVSALVQTESTMNPHAIGIVDGSLERQPRNHREAVATANTLLRDGWNFSAGLAQINRHNFARTALTVETAFDPCRNLSAMQALLLDCFERASRPAHDRQTALRRALSCYYSGDFRTGFRHGYVQRVVRESYRTRPP